MPRQDEFQIRPATNGGYYWHLIAVNNEIVCSSQVYTTKDACQKGAFWVKDNAASTTVYDYTKDS